MKSEIYELLGDLENFDQNKNYVQALEYFEVAHEANRTNIDIIVKIAKVHEKLREFDMAIEFLNMALR